MIYSRKIVSDVGTVAAFVALTLILGWNHLFSGLDWPGVTVVTLIGVIFVLILTQDRMSLWQSLILATKAILAANLIYFVIFCSLMA